MPRLSQSRTGSHYKSPELSLPGDFPGSPGSRQLPKYDVDSVGDPRPSTPEEWLLFARTKLETADKTADVIQDLADVEPNLLEFLISADEGIRGAVRNSVCGLAFPTMRALWLNSLSCSLFQRFLTYFNRVPPNLNLVDRIIDEACRQVMPYMVILSALGPTRSAIVEHEHEEEDPTTESQKREARIAMRSPAHKGISTVDPRLYTIVGLQYPTTPRELQEVETRVLQRLQVVLEVLLDAFENPELGRYSKTLVFGGPLHPVNNQLTQAATVNPSTEQHNATMAAEFGAFSGLNNRLPELIARQAATINPGPEPTTGDWILSLSYLEVDWEKTGRKYFDKGLYSQAIFCFGKADLLVERDIAAAYESRKQARLLQVSQPVDRETTCAAFTTAAEEFLGCAVLSKENVQTACYLRAAECYLQAEDWTAAAKAYYSAKDFNMTARTYRRSGRIDEAVEVVKNHRGDMQKNLVEETFGVARLEYFRTNQLEKASGLFDKVEEQLEYMEDYGFAGDLIHVLEHHQRYEQAAEIAFAENDVVEGVRLLSKSDNPGSVRKAIEVSLRGLWKLVPFGLTGDRRQNPVIGSLIQLLSDVEALSDEESCELEAFKALHANDIEGLLALAESSQAATLDSECQPPSSPILALLCFSHSSHLLAPRRNSTLPEFIKNAKLVLSYIGQLLRFARSLDITSLNTQKLLAFEPVESAEKGKGESQPSDFWIYSTSLMFESAQKVLGDIAPSSSVLGLSSLATSGLDTRRLVLAAIREMVRSEVQRMHDAASPGLYFYPCLEFAIFGECYRSECGRQEVNSYNLPDEQRQELFNQRTRALIVQIQLVHNYQTHTHGGELERQAFRRAWARKLYENLMPHFPPLGSSVCIDSRRIPELADSTSVISTWCEATLHELDPGSGPRDKFLSDVLVHLDISFRIHRQSYILGLHSRELVHPRDDLMIERIGPDPVKYSIIHDFINFYTRRSPDVISRAVRAVHHIVFQSLAIEANVLVNMLEFIGRELIVQWRYYQKGGDGVFDELLFPRSWAFDLVKRPPLPPQQGIPLRNYITVLYKTLELLDGYEPGSSPLYIYSGSLGLLVRSILIMRICRLIVLVANNMSIPPFFREEIRRVVVQSLNGPSTIMSSLCAKFARANCNSWHDLWNAVRYSVLNRGADELVFLSRRRDDNKPPNISAVKSIVYSNLNPELERLLSLVEPSTMLDPKVQSVPQAHNHAPTEANTRTTQLNQTAPDDQLNIGEPPDLVASVDPASTSQVGPKCPLTVSELESGKKILFCYRRYALRQRIKTRAVKKIWACYRRHQLRHKSPMTEIEEEIRKIHEEYNIDVESIHAQSNPKAFRHHKRLLLGFMPHVLIYLRGLTQVNQQQKEANKRRLKRATHAELDSIQVRMGACAVLTKRTKILTGRISPGSPILLQIDALVAEVGQVNSLRLEIMNTFGQDAVPKSLEEHYILGISVILSLSLSATAP